MNIINPYRFAAAATPTPLHWWDLDTVTASSAGILDQGTGDWGYLTPAGSPALSSGGGPNGQDVADLDFNEYFTGGDQSWDGSGGQVTMSIWAELDALDTTGSWLLSWRNSSTPRTMQLAAYNDTTDFAYAVVWDDDGDNVSTFADKDATVPTDGTTWVHYAATWDGTTLRMYKDGSETGTATNGAVGSTLEQTATAFRIGRLDTGSNHDTDGRVAMCGIWDTALSPDDIGVLYNSGNGAQYADIWG